MYVWVLMGNMGAGKSAGAVILSQYFAAHGRAAGLDVDLYSNFDMLGGKPLKSYEDFYEVARSPNSIVIMDEAHVNLDARMFHKGGNIYMTQFFFYFRKLHCSLFLCSPHIRNLDARIRNLTNVLVLCEKTRAGFSYIFIDYHSDRLLAKKFLPMATAKKIFRTGVYDTHALIRAIEFPSNERSFDNFLDKVIEIREGGRNDAARWNEID